MAATVVASPGASGSEEIGIMTIGKKIPFSKCQGGEV
jgi:hypothetical protein